MLHLLICSFVLSVISEKILKKSKKPKETQPQEQVTEEKPQFLADFFQVGKSLSQLPFTSPKMFKCISKNYCTVKSLTISVLLLLPVLNKKYTKPDVSENTCTENSTVGCQVDRLKPRNGLCQWQINEDDSFKTKK